MRMNSEHVLKPRNMKIEERQKPSPSHQITSIQDIHDDVEIRHIIQQFGSSTENITITNEWLKYPETLEIQLDLGTRAVS